MFITLLECHVNLDLEGFEDRDETVNQQELKLPYVVTIEEGKEKFYRLEEIMQNWRSNKTKISILCTF